MNIVLCGASCTGKSTIARLVAENLKCDVRGCGEIVRMTAKQLGVKLAELPPEIHWSIDADTLMFANEKNRLKVIEGRFLRYVLANSVEPTFVIELAASNNARCLRWETRTGKPFMKEDLLRLDEEDRIFCRSMYAEVVAIESSVCLDTSDLSVEECQEIVLNAIRSCTCVRCD